MSLFRTEALRVYAGESRLAMVRTSGRGRVLDAVELALPGEDAAAASRLLAEWALSQSLPNDLPLHVVMAQSQVPVVVLPWSDDLARPAFAEALARGLLEKQLALPASAYRLLLSPLHFGEPQLAAFVPERALQDWAAAADRAGLRLVSVTPQLAAVWDRFVGKVPAAEGALVVVAEDRVMTAYHRHRLLQRMTLRPLDTAQLQATFAQAGGQSLQVLVPPALESLLPSHARRLDPGLAQAPALSTLGALALCGGA